MDERYARKCTTCGNENYHREQHPPVPIPLAKRFESFVLGFRLPSHSPPESVNLCIDSDNQSDTHRRWVRCLTCGARYISELYEEVSWNHDRDGDMRETGYRCDVAEYDRSLALARACPHPDDHKCPCPAHTTAVVTTGVAWRTP